MLLGESNDTRNILRYIDGRGRSVMDEKGRRILALLEVDSRLTYAEIG